MVAIFITLVSYAAASEQDISLVADACDSAFSGDACDSTFGTAWLQKDVKTHTDQREKTNAKYIPLSSTEGIRVKTRDQLPQFGSEASGRITFRQTGLGWSDQKKRLMAAMFDQHHTGIQVEVGGGGESHAFTLEMWDDITALTNETKQSLWPPSFTPDGAPVWPDSVSVIYTPFLDEQYWGMHSEEPIELGTASATQLNELMDFTITYANNKFNRLYRPFTVWSSPLGTTKEKLHGLDNICDSFAEHFYFEMARVGADLSRDIPRIKRNYAPIISLDFNLKSPTLVDATDPAVGKFYEKVKKLGTASQVLASVSSFDQFFFPAQVGDPTAYPSKYIKILNPQSPYHAIYHFVSKRVGLALYEPMPLPQVFLNTCNKKTTTCRWWCWRGGNCEHGSCICSQCAYQHGKYHVCAEQK